MIEVSVIIVRAVKTLRAALAANTEARGTSRGSSSSGRGGEGLDEGERHNSQGRQDVHSSRTRTRADPRPRNSRPLCRQRAGSVHPERKSEAVRIMTKMTAPEHQERQERHRRVNFHTSASVQAGRRKERRE